MTKDMRGIFYYTASLAFVALALACPRELAAQEALGSAEEAYYDFLSLQGLVERPTLNYRTLSDAVWALDERGGEAGGPGAGSREAAAASGAAAHPWRDLNLGTTRQLTDILTLRIYGPELFTSYNTAAPYGQNDGALWQGRGFNASLTAGARLEFGNDRFGRVEGTLKPQIAFSQNLAFDIMPVEGMTGAAYAGKADTYGYFWGVVDAPQRFGDESFFTFDWGDSEIRYTWKTLTIGFGTQAVWLGPAVLNPILHSNNAPSYPKLDIGLRRQRVTLPWLGWYVGDVEARLWTGRLEESAYFDDDDSNDYTMFHGLALAYAPSFAPGLTLFANRVCLVPWEWEYLRYIVPFAVNNSLEDQKASFGFSYLLSRVNFEVYGELGVDDYVPWDENGPETIGYLRYPLHTLTYTLGAKKKFNVAASKNIYGELIFEWNSMEMSQEFQFQWPYTFYYHGQMKHGYTNKGAWLGAGSGWAGSSQYVELKLYYPQGTSSFFVHRDNPDNNFLFSKAVNASAADGGLRFYYRNMKANFNIGLSTSCFVNKKVNVTGGVVYNLIINPLYYTDKADPWNDDYGLIHNAAFQCAVKYAF